ncbi:MAG: DUF4230 domain-containing protein, partial [Anaerolineae bacterium]|nr:DUF4230 domain-containing protein [Anaerolineae bacterium]
PEYIPPPPPLTGTIIPGEDIYADPPRQGCSGCAWGVGGALGCLLLLILPVVVLLLMGVITVNGLLSGVQNVLSPKPAVATVFSTQTIVTGIQPMGQLVSVSSQLAKADIAIGVQQGALNACGFSANHVAQGTVEGGIDLTKISDTDVQYDAANNTYTVLLPAPQVTSCRIDFIRQYERSLTACPVDWDEARLLAQYEALNAFRTDAVEGGILQRAEQEARIVIANFVAALTGAKVQIVFKSGEGQAFLPPSCVPEVPPGWSYDATTKSWTQTQ